MLDRITDAITPRLTEPSTWVGIATFGLNLAGFATLSADLAGPLSVVLSGLASIVLVVLRESRKPKATP